MKTKINQDNWLRKEQYRFFSGFDEPFFGVTVRTDVTKAYLVSRQEGRSFFLYYLYRALKAANEIDHFRYRIIENEVYLYSRTHASTTVDRPDGTFGFAYIKYDESEQLFCKKAAEEIDKTRKLRNLETAVSGENYLHFSALPWLDFTSLSHARSFKFNDSSPKISFGRMTDHNGIKTMPVSIHGHHALMDGIHIGQFIRRFQELLDE